MPTIQATELTQPFSMTSSGTADFSSIHPSIGSNENFFNFVTTNGWEITLFGAGITYDGSGMPIGGTVS